MNLWRRSLGEDAVDHYNHTWSVLLLLLLSLITWLVPLNVYQTSPNFTKTSTTPTMSRRPIEYQADCWCPAQFEDSQVAYTNSVCGLAFNAALRGDKGNNRTDATLYEISQELFPEDHDSRGLFNPPVHKTDQRTIPRNGKTFVDTNTRSIVRDLLTITTPLMLFIFAVCLKLSHIIRHLLFNLGCTTLNVDRTLDAAVQGRHLSLQDQRQLNQDLAQATADDVRSSPRSASLTYILFKVLLCLVVVAEIVVVNRVALSQVNNAKHEVAAKQIQEIDLGQLLRERLGLPKTGVSQETHYDGTVLLCNFIIRQMTNHHGYVTQCVFKIAPSAPDVDLSTSGHTAQTDQLSQDKIWLSSYETLFTALLAYLTLLLVVDVISTLTWIRKLFIGSCRGHAPVDVHLLLLMSRENAGPLVTRDLTEHMTWSNKRETEREVLTQ